MTPPRANHKKLSFNMENLSADLRALCEREHSELTDRWYIHRVGQLVCLAAEARGISVPLCPPPTPMIGGGPNPPQWAGRWVEQIVEAAVVDGGVRDVLVALLEEVGGDPGLASSILAAVGGGLTAHDAASAARELVAHELSDENGDDQLAMLVMTSLVTLALIAAA